MVTRVEGTLAARAELVSIIVPCYNAERWLGAALDSALSQTWPSVEVIVVDDGSSDGSLALAQSYGSRIRLDSGPNRGPAGARNRGLELATGRWVQFLDSDDLLLPRKLEDGLLVADGPQDIPFSELMPFGRPPPSRAAQLGAWLAGPPAPFDPVRPLVTALTYEIQTSQPLFPTALLRQVGGFRSELRWLEDIDLNVRLVLAGARYVPTGSVGVLLRDHSSPGRQRLAPGAAVGRLQGERAMMEAVRQAGQWSSEVAAVFADRLAYAGRQAWLAGEKVAAQDAFVLARSLARPLGHHPRSSRIPVYNAATAVLGLERTLRLAGTLSRPR
jgi:hypothetical protein